jgi:hypothetical protein
MVIFDIEAVALGNLDRSELFRDSSLLSHRRIADLPDSVPVVCCAALRDMPVLLQPGSVSLSISRVSFPFFCGVL